MITLWYMKKKTPCSVLECRIFVNPQNFSGSGLRGRNGGYNCPFWGGPFLQALGMIITYDCDMLDMWHIKHVTISGLKLRLTHCLEKKHACVVWSMYFKFSLFIWFQDTAHWQLWSFWSKVNTDFVCPSSCIFRVHFDCFMYINLMICFWLQCTCVIRDKGVRRWKRFLISFSGANPLSKLMVCPNPSDPIPIFSVKKQIENS